MFIKFEYKGSNIILVDSEFTCVLSSKTNLEIFDLMIKKYESMHIIHDQIAKNIFLCLLYFYNNENVNYYFKLALYRNFVPSIGPYYNDVKKHINTYQLFQ